MKTPFLKRQGGAATIVTVMALLLVMALLAAFGNRGLLFELRMATGYQRSDLVTAVGETGLDWTQAMLNAGLLDASCRPVAAGGTRFRDAYLASTNAKTRAIDGILPGTPRLADCQRDAGGHWSCRCPQPGKLGEAPALPAAEAVQPSFAIQIPGQQASPPRAGALQVNALACSQSDPSTCAKRHEGEAQATTSALLGLVSAVRTPPSAPLTVKGTLSVNDAGGALGLHNADPRSGGTLLLAGGACEACKPGGLIEARSETLPGSTLDTALIAADAWMAQTAEPFRHFLGMTASRYRNHPALRVVPCQGDCAKPLQDAIAAGHQMLWVEGKLQLGSAVTLGSPARPVLLIATEDVAIQQPIRLHGLLLAGRDLAWSGAAGGSLVSGMVLVGRDAAFTGPVDIHYTQAVADHLRNVAGSFVRVPDSWKH